MFIHGTTDKNPKERTWKRLAVLGSFQAFTRGKIDCVKIDLKLLFKLIGLTTKSATQKSKRDEFFHGNEGRKKEKEAWKFACNTLLG